MIIDDDDNTVLIHSDLVIYKKMVMDFGGFCDGLFDEICVCVVGSGNWFLRVKLLLMNFCFFSFFVLFSPWFCLLCLFAKNQIGKES
jgi:hypothetical protein